MIFHSFDRLKVVTYEMVQKWQEEEMKKMDDVDDSKVDIVLAGDLSFSYNPDKSKLTAAQEMFRSLTNIVLYLHAQFSTLIGTIRTQLY